MTRPVDLQQTIARTKNIEKMQQLQHAQPHEDQKKFRIFGSVTSKS